MKTKPFCTTNLALLAAWLLSLAVAQQALAGKPDKDGPSKSGYTTVTLDDRSGAVRSWVNDAREANDTVLCVGNLDGDTAVLWEVTPNGSDFTVATHYLANGEFADSINANEEIVGYGSTFDASTQLWLNMGLYWPDRGSTPLVLPAIDGDNETVASGINAAGVIVGRSAFKYAAYDEDDAVEDIFEEQTAVAWRAVVVDNVLTVKGPYVLGPQPGVYSAGYARDINECNANGVAQAVGITEDGPVGWNVQCEQDGSLTVLTGPISLVPQDLTGWGSASGINNNGDACGIAIGAVAFRTLADGTFEELPTPRNAFSEAKDINDSGQAVGHVIDPRKGEYGALWKTDGSRVDLNSVLGRSSSWRRIWWATSITPNGIISATGALDADGENGRALLMMP